MNNHKKFIKDIKVLAWWKYVRKKPIKMKQVSCLVAIISNTQPKGMQVNFSKECKMCNERCYESVEHILLRCSHLNTQRLKYNEIIKGNMPLAMATCYEAMTITEKCDFLLSGFNSSYVDQWESLYGVVADFVWEMYKCRYTFYNEVVQGVTEI